MKARKQPQIWRIIPFLMVACLFGFPAHAQYGGGTGEPNDPYLIYTPAHLQAIGLDPNSWDKHFKLMSDLDMIAYQGASESETVRPIGTYSQRPFSGHFDGNAHTISHLTIRETGLGPAGLFGFVQPPLPSGFPWELEAVEVIRDSGLIDPNVQSPSVEVIRDLGLIDPNVQSASYHGVGALVGYLSNGKVSSCYVKGGRVMGKNRAGGLIGDAPSHNMPTPHVLFNCCVQDCDVQGGSSVGGLVGEFGDGLIDACWSVARVRGHGSVGGLAGLVETFWGGHGLSMCWSSGTVEGASETGGLVGECRGHGWITGCYSTAAIRGGSATGGLVGTNIYAMIANCYSVAPVSGLSQVGGLVGVNQGTVSTCYAAGLVRGQLQVGGLIGSRDIDPHPFYPDLPEGPVSDSFWDTEASGQTTSAGGGTGKTTAEMQTAATFLAAGWDFVGETANGTEDVWRILEGQDYPRLWWEREPGEQSGPGDGEPGVELD